MLSAMQWDPTQFFRDPKPLVPFALLVLNQPINERAFAVLRKHACYIVCADGGSNRYYDLMKAHGRESVDLPNAIIGDLDSIHPHVRTHYANLAVSIIHDPDQYSTDFTKCLKYLRYNASTIVSLASTTSSSSTPLASAAAVSAANARDEQEQEDIEAEATGRGGGGGCAAPPTRLDVVILGGLGGRVDQAFSQIHHLYAMSQSSSESPGDLYLVSEESISFVLQKGKNTIHTPGARRHPQPHSSHQDPDEEEKYYLEENIGILPIAGPAVITTHGFEWDVRDWRTEMGGQISTSNHIRADVVGVETTVPVLFTAELAGRFKWRSSSPSSSSSSSCSGGEKGRC
ncbi:hypothetical protein VTN00DRAFT_2063 [Thermoascus crustaceus]|uniref:uncharacterized protein n=1 Tax=Thermoascus crustaceus TaxID=5088 RepID=UPI0037447EF6